MRLVSLRIYKKNNEETLRNVTFNEKGLSLICDEEGDEHHFSGSSIGKTAFAKCIDICLGASSTKSLYKSSGTGDNDKLEDYIKSNKLSIQLRVKDNKNKEFLLERHLFDNKEFIDGVVYSNINKYNAALMNIFFPGCISRLTFRNIIPKFIRMDGEEIFKYIRAYGSNETYYYAYNYLLNLYVNDSESSLLLEKVELQKNNIKIEKQYKIKSIDEFDEYVNKEQEKLCLKRKSVVENDYIGQYSNQDKKNSNLIFELDELTDELYSKQLRIDIIEKNICREEKKFFDVDNNVLLQIYDDAKKIFGEYLTNYNDLVNFHNKMCSLRKESYIQERNNLLLDIKKINENITNLRKQFNDTFVDYKTVVNDASNSLYDQYYKSKVEFDSLVKCKNDYSMNINRLNEIEKNLTMINEKKNFNEENKNRFKEIFKENCKQLLKVTPIINFNDSPNEMPISINGIGGLLGTGDTKTLICAFDFSLYEYFIDKSLNRPYFVIHDKMESVPLENLEAIFEKARNSGIQYILPILHDRIEMLNVTNNEIILSLSKKEKLFKC